MNVRSPQDAAAARGRVIAELKQAVAAEAAATKARAEVFRAELVSGKLLRDIGDGHVYTFLLQTVVPIADDAPGELHIGSQVYACRVVAVEGLRVTLLLALAPAPVIERALLVAQPWVTLERLRGALASYGAGQPGGPGMGGALFAGDSVAAAPIEVPPPPETDSAKTNHTQVASAQADAAPTKSAQDSFFRSALALNELQQQALAAALGRTVAVIAGPAGTGKTRLLGIAAAACAAAGLRVLILAPTNVAVDGMLGAYVEAGGSAACAAGEALRLGCSAVPDRWQAHPHLSPALVEERLKAQLAQELDALADERATVAARDQTLRVLQKAVDLARQAAAERAAVQAEVDALLPGAATAESQTGEALGGGRLRAGLRAVWQRAKRLARQSAPGGHSLYRDDVEWQRHEAYGRQQRLVEARTRLAERIAAAQRLQDSLAQQLAAYGLQEGGVAAACTETAARLRALEEKKEACDRALSEVGRTARAQARVVASTAQYALQEGTLAAAAFDIVLIDDAHRMPAPLCYWAAGLAASRIVIAGDAGTLPPWYCAPEAVALRWLGRSMVDYAASAGGPAQGWLVTLTERHGPHSRLNAAIEGWFGGTGRNGGARPRAAAGAVPDRRRTRRRLPVRGHTVTLAQALADENPLVLADTAPLKAWCEVIPQEGRINLASAHAAVALAAQLRVHAPDGSIALVTPYAAQARLLLLLARADAATRAVNVFAPPCLPTRGADVVILDTVETPGAFAWSPLDDTRPDSQAAAFFRDVCTQARQRVIVVAHWKHVRDSFGARACLRRMLSEAVGERRAVSAAKLVRSERAGSLPHSLTSAARVNGPGEGGSAARSGWRRLLHDVQAAEHGVSVWSPQLAPAVAERVLGVTPPALLASGAVRVTTLPQAQRGGQSASGGEALRLCEQMGAAVAERAALAASLVIVDDRIVWNCTFAPLGGGARGAEMRRLENVHIARVLRELLAAAPGDAAQDVAAIMPFTEAASLLAGSNAGALERP